MEDESTLVGEEVTLSVPIYVENDIECDADGNLQLQTFLYADKDDEEGTELSFMFNEVVDKCIEYYQEENNNDSRNRMYCIAHELSRQAEKLRNKADYMDRGLYSEDLFKDKED